MEYSFYDARFSLQTFDYLFVVLNYLYDLRL